MPEVPVFRHFVKISRPAQPVQYADVEGCLTFPELECLQHFPVSGEVGGHVALHGGLASPQDVRPEEFRPGGDETAPVIRGEHPAALPRLFHQPCVVRAEIIDAQFVGIPVYRAKEVVRIILEIALRPLQSPACVIEEQHALSGLQGQRRSISSASCSSNKRPRNALRASGSFASSLGGYVLRPPSGLRLFFPPGPPERHGSWRHLPEP